MISNLETFPKGGCSRLATPRDLCTPHEAVPLDDSFDLHKRLQLARRQILSSRSNENRSSSSTPGSKRSGGSIVRPRRSSNRTVGQDYGPDMSFLHHFDVGLNDSSSNTDSSGVSSSKLEYHFSVLPYSLVPNLYM